MATIEQASISSMYPGKLPPQYEDIIAASDGEAFKMLFLNITEGELVHQRFILIHGKVHGVQGTDDQVVVHHQNFPSQTFPAVDGYFKVLARLDSGNNRLNFEYLQCGKRISQGSVTLNMSVCENKQPLRLVIMVAKDSPETFDAPPGARGPGLNDLDAAVSKLRCCAYMWQAFFAEQMYRQGFGRRTFTLEEECLLDTMGRDGKQRLTAKVHIIRSESTVAEIQDKHNMLQYHASIGDRSLHKRLAQLQFVEKAVKESKQFVGKQHIAALTLDSHWDPELELERGHGTFAHPYAEQKLVVFGSLTTHAWPACIEDVPAKFMNSGKLDTKYVANYRNQCDEYWKAASCGQGVFLRMLLSSLSVINSPSGMAAGDHINYNRTFMVKEPGFEGPIKQNDELGAHIFRIDAVRLRYQPCFCMPGDLAFHTQEYDSELQVLAVEDGLMIGSKSGIVLIQLWVDGKYRNHIEYTDENHEYRKNSPHFTTADEVSAIFPSQVVISKNRLVKLIGEWAESDTISVTITARLTNWSMFKEIEKMFRDPPRTDSDGVRIFSTSMLGRGERAGSVKSAVSFSAKAMESSAPKLCKLEIFSGGNINCIVFHTSDNAQVQIGTSQEGEHSVLEIGPDDDLDHIVVRSGWWIDGLEFVTAKGHRSGWKGNSKGGAKYILKPPTGYECMGLEGSGSNILDSLTMLYAKRSE